MSFSKIEWRDDLNIGVEVIDKAHKELFSIVRKLMDLSSQDMGSAKSQRACLEGVKFFKNYVVEHFQQEEEYMKSIKYKHYLAHKRRHDLLKNETLPALERELSEEDFSREAVEHFFDVCIGWLTTHIAIEDQAIVRNYDVRWDFEKDNAIPGLERLFKEASMELFNAKIELADKNYNGDPLDRAICMEFVFKNTSGKRVKILYEVEERLVTKSVAQLLRVPFIKINDISLTATTEIMLSIIQRVAPKAKLLDTSYQLESEQRVLSSEVKTTLENEYFKYKLRFDSDSGSFAFCYTMIV